MVLSKSLKKNNILIKIKAKDKWELIDRMLSTAIKNNDINKEDQDFIKKLLIEREKSMSTGIGKGIALPHCTTAKVDDAIIVLATSDKGIDFDSIDGVPVKIIILLVVPKNKLTQHIKTLANIAKTMGDEKFREAVINADTQENLIDIIKQYENPAKK